MNNLIYDELMSHRYIELTKSVMARKCPPGVICVQNAMFVLCLLFLRCS